jgi:hypothetical protein
VTTGGRQFVRVLLYGCAHKPKFGAFSCPKVGEVITCYFCGRGRTVVGIETGWKDATVTCTRCPWKFASEKAGKKRMFVLAHRHADARDHIVHVNNDGHVTVVPPKVGQQLKLIDDLLLPD